MYCSVCGNALSPHLNYCNHCGARNERNALIVSNSSMRTLPIATGVIGVSGLIGTFAILKILLESRLDTSAIVVILLAYLAVVFLMFSVLVGHMWKRSGEIRVHGPEPKDLDPYVPPASLRPLNTSQLEAAGEPGSITEHTTRTLDEVYVERK